MTHSKFAGAYTEEHRMIVVDARVAFLASSLVAAS